MAIKFNNVSFGDGGTAKFNNTSLDYIKFNNTQVWRKSITYTDLINFKGWSTRNWTDGVNTTNETSTVAYNAGFTLYRPAPDIGYNEGGIASQSIPIVAGHKYWVAFGICPVSNTPCYYHFPKTVGAVSTLTEVSQVITADTTESYSAFIQCMGDSSNAYTRVSYVNVVDLTACCGAGNEPTAEWCLANLGKAFSSKTL